MRGTSGSNEIRAEIRRLQNENDSISKKIGEANIYKSPHWDEPNVLAHVRTNDRMMGDKKTLHMEEVQSDWHQKGRKEGYLVGDAEKQRMTKELQDLQAERAQLVGSSDPAARQRYSEIAQKEADLTDRYNALVHDGVPNAPFKDTDAWAGLAMKRMIRHAAEKGYDRISWTPGEAQAARYDLSKQLDHVEAIRYSDDTYRINGIKGDEEFPLANEIAADKLPDYVGKDLAQKIVDAKQKPNATKRYSGVDLKVGGEGMREFYDKILPKIAEKIGKAHGVKVQRGEVPTGQNVTMDKVAQDLGYGGWHSNLTPAQQAHIEAVFDAQKKEGGARHPVPYFDIPPSLREQALKGMSMFQRGGRVKSRQKSVTLGKTRDRSAALKAVYRLKNTH
jgi:hypothetical protein